MRRFIAPTCITDRFVLEIGVMARFVLEIGVMAGSDRREIMANRPLYGGADVSRVAERWVNAGNSTMKAAM
jgi:hypothetical protein